MNQKELGELRRRFRPDKNAITHIYGCFVNSRGEIISYLDESLGVIPQEEAEKYLSFLKKSLSGTLGKNLIDLVFSTEQVVDSEEHRLLSKLRNTALKDGEVRERFYQQVIHSLDMGDDNYLILLAHDSYDVPHRGKDDALQPDASDQVFSYIVSCICPVREGKVELGYFPGDNEFHCTAGQTVAAPELGFLFPAFDDRAANLYNALFYSRKADELHQEFIDAVFHTEVPMSAIQQREAFQTALTDALEDDCSMEVVHSLHDYLREKIGAHKESKDPEPLALTVKDLSGVLADCGVAEERVEAFVQGCGAQFGEGAALSPANLVDVKHFQVKTPDATIAVEPDRSFLVETRIIDGRKYLLIPADENVEVNGLGVRVKADTQE